MRVFHLLVQKTFFLLISSFIAMFTTFVTGQETKAYDEQYRQNTYELLKTNKTEDIEVQYWGELKLPYLNVWETLYFHLVKGEFELFFAKIEEYSKHINRSNKKDKLFYYNPQSIDDREYLFDNQTRDNLWDEVKRRISKRPNELFAKMLVADLSLHEQDFIELFLYYMVWYFYRGEEQIDQTLSQLAHSFLQKFPDDKRGIDFIERFIIVREKKGNIRMIADLGTDYTLLSNALKEHVAPNTGFTFSSKLMFGYKNVFTGLGVSALDAKVKKDFHYEIPWMKDSTSNITNIDAIMGYSYRLHKNISVHPFMGYRFSSMRHRFTNIEDENLNQTVTLTSNTPIIGCYFDLEFAHNHWEKLSEPINRESYSANHYGLRLGVQYVLSNYGRHTPNLQGNMLLFSIKLMTEFKLNSNRRKLD